MEKLILFIVKELVTCPDHVKIENKKDGNMNVITIFVDENDLGKVIGLGGKTIKAIRTISKNLANKNLKYAIKVKSNNEWFYFNSKSFETTRN